MLAFAANSVLGRLALTQTPTQAALIDPANYTLIRLISGAIVLGLLAGLKNGFNKTAFAGSNIISAFSLFLYAAAFSFSYVAIDTGLGALILFACVQLTMMGWAVVQKYKFTLGEILGSLVAFGALIWLVSPGVSAPDPIAAVLMAISGIAWGIYSIRGQKSASALSASAGNFLLTIPMTLILIRPFDFNPMGIALAVTSGAITSGLGYALWYSVLPKLTTSRAAISQLSVPVLAGIGGSFVLSENWTLRFTIASTLILGGIALAIISKRKTS